MAAPKSIPSLRPFEPDERQRQAIEHVGGPMLVVAGAGTGKTTVLIKRIAYLVRNAGVRPDEILAVTYTDNAAKEMRERVEAELRGTDISGLQAKTFHAYCNEMLEKRGKKFDLIEDCDLWIYLRRHISDLNLKYFIRAANLGQFLHDLLDFIRRCQDELVSPEKYEEYVRRVVCGELVIPRVSKSKQIEDLKEEDVLGRCREIASVFAIVTRKLREMNLGTYGQMITGAYDLLCSNPALLADEQKRTRFILVDEFQDANFAQVKIIQKLAGEDRNVFAVGDPDQAIYRFRGASSAAFALFHRHFDAAKLVVLDKNRRSTTPILETAFAAISKNPDGFAAGHGSKFPYRRSPLVSAREEEAQSEGKPFSSVMVDVAVTDKDVESSDIISVIQEKKKQLRCSWKDFAVIYRQHSHRDEIVQGLVDKGIPFSIENMDVRDTAEVRDLFACAGAVVSLRDSASLFRVAALPQFTVDPQQLRKGIRALPKDDKTVGVSTVLAQSESGKAVLEVLQQAREEIDSKQAKAFAALEIIIRRFALDRSARPVRAVMDFVERWEKKPIVEKGVLGELLDYLSQLSQARGSIPMPADQENAVTLITVHGAKGLEFNHVFILRVVSPSFPCPYREPLVAFPQDLRDPDSVAQGDNKTLNDEEERRLFYVAMTRARDSLTLYGKRGRGKVDPTPPGYLREFLKDRNLKPWLREREARGFQTEIFAAAAAPASMSHTNDWVSLPPASDLGARLSASAVTRYEMCPLQFKLEREWRLPTEPPAPMQNGAAMHRVLHEYYDSVRFDRPMDEDGLLRRFRDYLIEAGIQDPYQRELYENQGVEQLKSFVALSRERPVPSVLHTEETFEIPFNQIQVSGRIDRIDDAGDGRVIITDYKTGRLQSQDDADKSLQLSIYALAAREKWGYRVDHLVLYNLTENSAIASTRSEAQLTAAKERVAEVASKIAGGMFDPNPDFHCGFCPYRSLCPAKETRLHSPGNDKKTN